MKCSFLALFLILCSYGSFAQKAKPKPKGKAPVKKTASKSKTKSKTGTKIKTNGDDEYDLFICYENGPCTFTILKGDTLVYDVNQQGKSFKLFVIPNKFDAGVVADFNWFTSEPDNKKGKVTIGGVGLKTADKYMSVLPMGDLKLTDASSTLWLSEKSFKEITKGASNMIFDNGTPESYSSPEADASIVTITYKDKSIDLDGFAIQNKNLGQAGRKELSVLNISSNLLILKLETDGGSMVLKEVRQNISRK